MSAKRVKYLASAAGMVGLLTLAGCSQETSDQAARFGLLAPASDRATGMGNLWVGAWVASLIIGVVVWGLIFFAIIRYRKRKGDDSAPRQTKYHLPMELLYTLVPFLIIGVLFFYTVRTQNDTLKKVDQPDHVVNVVGHKWSWTFNYMEESNPQVNSVVHKVGTMSEIPDLYLPVNKAVRFNLASADVIHSFWIPAFYFKLDVIPGHPNSFDLTPTKVGTYDGKCAELCGTYHANMIFKVHVVSEADYVKYLQGLKAAGETGEIKPPVSATQLASATPKEPGK